MRPLHEQLSDATRLTKSGNLSGAVASIQAALTGGFHQTQAPSAQTPAEHADIVLRPLRKLDVATPRLPRLLDYESKADDEASQPRVSDNDISPSGHFLRSRFANDAGAREYQLFVPPAQHGKRLPLVVMLHGCTQDSDAFAAGTGMNEIALKRGFYVLYPAQAQSANANRCWNWFEKSHQQRDMGEPGILAGMTRDVFANHDVDPQRIYVAGLSAGGAMAVILGDTYPDLYAAIGVHSGLPSGVAHDLPSALAAMKGGQAFGVNMRSPGKASQRSQPSSSSSVKNVPPTIVFHGDQDKTVRSSNGDQIVASCVRSASGVSKPLEARSLSERSRSNNGREYTRTSHRDADGLLISELWTIHGAGHAWSGGRKAGSYTDPTGPSASEEMIRFFFSHEKSA